MRSKGFTLIELLAVIVILAIIALIAVPAVLNIIEDSRKGAVEASARNIAKTAELYYATSMLEGTTLTDVVDLTTDTLTYDGDKPEKGIAIYSEDGDAHIQMYLDGYCVTVDYENKVASEKMEETECEVELPKKYANGEVVYFDPTTGTTCAEADAVSTTGTKDGCMKWYAFNDSETSFTVNLLLDHNTTAKIAWSSSGETTPTKANAQLQTDIENWEATVKASARLIRATEVHKIAPRTDGTSWDVNDNSTYYYLHTGTTTAYQGDAGTNTYAWLFDNTYNCTTYGCNVAETSTIYGYWTSDHAGAGFAWYVDFAGYLLYDTVANTSIYGVRPVITISKSILSN